MPFKSHVQPYIAAGPVAGPVKCCGGVAGCDFKCLEETCRVTGWELHWCGYGCGVGSRV